MTTKNNEPNNIYKALLKFKSIVGDVNLDADNPFFTSKYPSLANVLNTIKPALHESGLIFIQSPNILDGVDVLNTKVLLAENPSECVESNMRLLMKKEDMQALGGAVTYARRYALVSMFGLRADDDDGTDAVKAVEKTQYEKAHGASKPVIERGLEKLKACAVNKSADDLEASKALVLWAIKNNVTLLFDEHAKLFPEQSKELFEMEKTGTEG
jgi:hypothetical protein